jgi:hypothetical protein
VAQGDGPEFKSHTTKKRKKGRGLQQEGPQTGSVLWVGKEALSMKSLFNCPEYGKACRSQLGHTRGGGFLCQVQCLS